MGDRLVVYDGWELGAALLMVPGDAGKHSDTEITPQAW